MDFCIALLKVSLPRVCSCDRLCPLFSMQECMFLSLGWGLAEGLKLVCMISAKGQWVRLKEVVNYDLIGRNGSEGLGEWLKGLFGGS